MSTGFEINQKAILRPTIHYTTPNVDFKTALHAPEMLSKMNIHQHEYYFSKFTNFDHEIIKQNSFTHFNIRNKRKDSGLIM